MKFGLFVISVVIGFNGNAVAAPCVSTVSDTDGVGWGYENGNSCQVTEGTSYIQTVYDPVLEAEVELERLQWEWIDFVEQPISCTTYSVDTSSNPKKWLAVTDALSTAYFASDGT